MLADKRSEDLQSKVESSLYMPARHTAEGEEVWLNRPIVSFHLTNHTHTHTHTHIHIYIYIY
jgi:hypothetical protein